MSTPTSTPTLADIAQLVTTILAMLETNVQRLETIGQRFETNGQRQETIGSLLATIREDVRSNGRVARRLEDDMESQHSFMRSLADIESAEPPVRCWTPFVEPTPAIFPNGGITGLLHS